jgi:putative ABC transport system permease protein
MAATVADGIVRTLTDRAVDLDQSMGTADVKISLRAGKKIDVEKALPPGSRVAPLSPQSTNGSLRLSVGDRIVRTRLRTMTLGDPLTAHLARLTAGRLPKGSGETLVTAPLAEKLGLLDADGTLRPHATVGAATGPRVTVTGLAVEPYCLKCAEVVAPLSSSLAKATPNGALRPVAYLVDLPPGVDAETLARTWPTTNSEITTRETFIDYTSFDSYVTGAVTEPIQLFAGLALLGIVITAGAAFAVGARSQMRELGLLAVNGGTAKHVRRIVLAQGLVLGVLGAATGLVVGAVVMVLGVPLWQQVTGQMMENPHFGWRELVAAAAVGVLASVVASVVPAFGVARTQPADALAGRFRSTPPRTRARFLGLALILTGAAAVVVSGVVIRLRMAELREQLERNENPPAVDRTLPVLGTLAGVAVAVVGLILVMPAVLTAVGRLGALLPLSGRLAVRDAVRHRHRTVAASAAIMVTVAASVVTAFVFTTQAARVSQSLPPNTVMAEIDSMSLLHDDADAQGQQIDHAGTNATRAVPGTVTVPITHVSAHGDSLDSGMSVTPYDEKPNCRDHWATVAIGTPELIELATGRAPDAGTRRALAEGKAVSTDACLVAPDGTVSLFDIPPDNTKLPVHLANTTAGSENWNLPKVFISPETAAAHEWAPHTDLMAITYPAQSDVEAIRTAVDDAGVNLRVAEPSGGYITGLYYLLAGLAAVVAFLGAGVTVALSATDGRADLATLAALGAAPRRRRTLAGAHALVVTVLGTLSGLVVGACAAFAAVPIMGQDGLPVPWQHLLVTALAVPLLAAVVAVLATPSRLPMVRRP